MAKFKRKKAAKKAKKAQKEACKEAAKRAEDESSSEDLGWQPRRGPGGSGSSGAKDPTAKTPKGNHNQ